MRLFFHTRKQGVLADDEQGAEFDSLEEAHREAIASAREIMAERIVMGRPIHGVSFEITDEHGKVVLTVPWEDALARCEQ
jgi:hypothetical protein